MAAGQYKVQLHDHSTTSDGAMTPAAVATAYKAAGFDAMVLSDHNGITANPEIEGISFIPGYENDVTNGHMGCVNVAATVASNVAQDVIDDVTGQGGIAVINHPTLTPNLWTDENIAALTGLNLLEIYNNKVLVLGGNPNGEAIWDAWNALPGKRFFGVASDDSHAAGEINKAWIVVNATSSSPADIVASLAAGNFYATLGPNVSVTYSGGVMTATTSASSTIEFIGAGGTVLQTNINSSIASYTVQGGDVYVRVRITRNNDALKAWSQPIWMA